MKKVKIAIILLVVIAIIITIIMKMVMPQKQQEQVDSFGVDISQDFIKNIGIVENYDTFFSVERMFNNYITKVQVKNKEAIYGLLEKEYITKNNITTEKVLNYVQTISKYNLKPRIIAMYSQENIDNAEYYIHAILENNKEQEKDFYFTLYEDRLNSRYSIVQIEKENFEDIINNQQKELDQKRISGNEYNELIYAVSSEEEQAKKHLDDFVQKALNDLDQAYDMIEEENKKSSFPNKEEFIKYVESKKEEFLDDEISEFKIEKAVKYTKFICTDIYGNKFTFYANGPLNYKVIIQK